MAVLQNLIDEAVGTGPVPPLLRRLKVLAYRIGTASSLIAWVDQELSGYAADAPLPQYRGPFNLHPLASLRSPWQTVNGVAVARNSMPEELQDSSLFVAKLRQPAAELEALTDSDMKSVWPAEALQLFNRRIAEGKTGTDSSFECLAVTSALPTTAIAAALDLIRGKALELALELETIAPDLGEFGAPEGARDQARQVIQNFDFSGATFSGANSAFGSTAVSQAIAD